VDSASILGATTEKPFLEDKSGGPLIDPAYFINFRLKLFRFATG
jgi:hypothetical protein